MKLFFGTQSAFLFSIELDSSNTVLEMKQKIEKSHGIPVSTQTIFFKGSLFLPNRDSHTLKQCKIFDKSHLELYFPGVGKFNRNTSQVLQQTEQSPVPSTSSKDIIVIEDSPERNQDSSLMDSSNNLQMLHQTEHSQVPPSNATGAFFNKDFPATARSNDGRMLHQPEKSLLSSCSIDELLHLIPVTPLTDQDMRKLQGYSPASTTRGDVNVQESSRRNENYQDLLQRESSNTFGHFSFGEDQVFQTEQSTVSSNTELSFGPLSTESFTGIQSYWHARTTEEERINDQDLHGSSNQVVQTVQSPPMREVITSPDSPERSSNKRPKNLRVMVLPYSGENKPVSKLLVDVNESENVEELKIELVKMQQSSQLHLPEGGYFFMHKERVLDEKQSFRWNRIDHGDTIQIFPASVTDADRTDT